jgi:hypothetical protein
MCNTYLFANLQPVLTLFLLLLLFSISMTQITVCGTAERNLLVCVGKAESGTNGQKIYDIIICYCNTCVWLDY